MAEGKGARYGSLPPNRPLSPGKKRICEKLVDLGQTAIDESATCYASIDADMASRHEHDRGLLSSVLESNADPRSCSYRG